MPAAASLVAICLFSGGLQHPAPSSDYAIATLSLGGPTTTFHNKLVGYYRRTDGRTDVIPTVVVDYQGVKTWTYDGQRLLGIDYRGYNSPPERRVNLCIAVTEDKKVGMVFARGGGAGVVPSIRVEACITIASGLIRELANSPSSTNVTLYRRKSDYHGLRPKVLMLSFRARNGAMVFARCLSKTDFIGEKTSFDPSSGTKRTVFSVSPSFRWQDSYVVEIEAALSKEDVQRMKTNFVDEDFVPIKLNDRFTD